MTSLKSSFNKLYEPCLSPVSLVLAIFLIFMNASSAQMRSFDCDDAPPLSISVGEAVLEKVQKAYIGIEAIHGNFRQESYLAALEASEASSGEMTFGRPGKMRWVYKEPKKQIVVIRDGTLWLYQVDKGQVMIDDIGQVVLSDLPVSFMMGLGNLSRDFALKQACKSPDGTVLSLVPRAKPGGKGGTSELSGFDLLVDSSGSLPKGARITSLGGNVTAILFERLEAKGVKPDPSEFVLEYPNGVDVMDRRAKTGS